MVHVMDCKKMQAFVFSSFSTLMLYKDRNLIRFGKLAR